MSEFSTIKKIIRLFTITLLALWTAQCLFGAHESAKVMSDAHQTMRMQALYTQGHYIRQMLRFFHIQHQRLPQPADYDQLECSYAVSRCPFREHDGSYYVREDQMWLAIEPVIEGDSLDFRCRVSHRYEGDSLWRPPFQCQLDATGLPFDWPATDSGSQLP